MRTIFLAHPSKFTAKILQDLANSHQIEIYCLDQFDDFTYLIDDLKPELFIIHQDIIDKYEDLLLLGLEKADFEAFPVLVLGDRETKISSEYRSDAVIKVETFFAEVVEVILKNH